MQQRLSFFQYPWFWLVCVEACNVFVCMSFLPHQSLWTDEATQMTGLALPLPEMLRWLLHQTSNYGLPYDRMPPLSYLLGKLWAWNFGFSIQSLRFFGVTMTAAGCAVVFHTAREHFGKRAAILAGLIFGISPNVIVIANEIRAYPLVLFFSAVAFYFQLKLFKQFKTTTLLGYTTACIALYYTHYFGLVYTGVSLVTLMIFYWNNKSYRKNLLYVGGVLTLFSLGLFPFIKAAFILSSEQEIGRNLMQNAIEIIRLVYRLVSHTSILMNKVVLGCLLVSILLSSIIGLFFCNAKPRINFVLAATIGLGFVLVAIANFVCSSFSPTTPSYSVWMLPGMSLFLVCGVVGRGGVNKLAFIVVIVIVLANGFGAYNLVKFGSYFSHGPYERLANTIKEYSPKDVAVIHDGATSHMGMVYFALYYFFGKELDQYRTSDDDERFLIFFTSGKKVIKNEGLLSKYRYVLCLRAEHINSQRLIRDICGNDNCSIARGPWATKLSKTERWHLSKKETLSAWTKIQIFLFENREFD